MNFDLKQIFTPLIAAAILTVIGLQTSDALRHSGAWRRPHKNSGAAADPYARLQAQITAPQPQITIATLRDPFSYGRAPVKASTARPRVYVPPPPPKPVLTAVLLGDDDPRALIHYGERDYTVKSGDLFAGYRVVSITAEQVVLDHDGQRLMLKRPTKGE